MSTAKNDEDMPAEFDLEMPEDVLALAERFYNEWCNGGFSQLFSNWYPADVALIPDGLRAIGAPEAAAIVQSAIAELGPRSEWRTRGRDALINPSSPLRPRLYALNDQFAEHADRLETLIADYELRLSGESDESGE
jgi:hypothetical protein